MEENEELEGRDLIIQTYLDLLDKTKTIPSVSMFVAEGVKRGKIRHHFGNIDNLHQFMSEEYADEIGKYFSTVDQVFNKEVQKTKDVYVITTAVADAKANIPFLNAIKSYCEKRNGDIWILPCESVTNSFENRSATFDRVFREDSFSNFITEDTQINNNLMLCSIQVSAKQIKPITGLQRIGGREGSYIFASPKQFLEYIPAGNDRVKNYAIMTPGACTLPHYYSEVFVSKRLSYIAEHDHTMGAIIVEVEDEDTFHFRQIQAAEDGSFIDLGVEYRADGSTARVPVNVVLGDIHGVQADLECIRAFSDMIASNEIAVDKLFLHDIFDGNSINHHIINIGEKAKRSLEEQGSLVDELRETWNVVNTIRKSLGADETFVVRSNHDEFLDRYLDEGRYVHDPENHYTAVKIAPSLFEDVIPLKYGFQYVTNGNPEIEELTFLKRSDSVKVAGIELGSHGDLGLNGAKSSLNSLEKIYGECVTAHVHSGAIQRGVFRVGTFTKLDLGYNRGPSSWTQTACLVYENGQRQLVNNVKGKFCKDMDG